MIYVLLGPTGSGKTELGVRFAQALDLEIINADAFQVYRSFPIATATPTEKEMRGVPHHLFGFLENDDRYDVARYQTDARKSIENIKRRSKTPLFVGGSGLYIRSALFDYGFEVDTSKVDMTPYQGLSDADLHAVLAALDEEEAQKIPFQNRRRVLRSIAICLAAGRSKTSLLAEQKHEPIEETLFFHIEAERPLLYERIEARTEAMFENGIIDEVLPQIQSVSTISGVYAAIGIKEFFPYRDGLKTLEEVKEDIKMDTRRYAKRQETFFRHQFKTVPIKSLEEMLSYVHR